MQLYFNPNQHNHLTATKSATMCPKCETWLLANIILVVTLTTTLISAQTFPSTQLQKTVIYGTDDGMHTEAVSENITAAIIKQRKAKKFEALGHKSKTKYAEETAVTSAKRQYKEDGAQNVYRGLSAAGSLKIVRLPKKSKRDKLASTEMTAYEQLSVDVVASNVSYKQLSRTLRKSNEAQAKHMKATTALDKLFNGTSGNEQLETAGAADTPTQLDVQLRNSRAAGEKSISVNSTFTYGNHELMEQNERKTGVEALGNLSESTSVNLQKVVGARSPSTQTREGLHTDLFKPHGLQLEQEVTKALTQSPADELKTAANRTKAISTTAVADKRTLLSESTPVSIIDLKPANSSTTPGVSTVSVWDITAYLISDNAATTLPAITTPRAFASLATTAGTMSGGIAASWPVKHASVMEGDLILGGLMMVHSREDTITCGPIMPQGGIQALEAMLYTLDQVNKHQLLPNVTLGAHILDDCDKDTYGLEMAVDFIKGNSIQIYEKVRLQSQAIKCSYNC